MSNINKSIAEINTMISDYQTKIQYYKDEMSNNKLLDIKYNNLKREMQEKTEFYENKISVLTTENVRLNDHLLVIKGLSITKDSNTYILKSIVESMIDELGIDKVADLVNIDGDKIKGYLE